MWGATNDVAFFEYHKSETFFPLAECLQCLSIELCDLYE